jgi:NAD(P)-dependent dehydrogenase (short-subunit alcohol dehydrogenase family)
MVIEKKRIVLTGVSRGLGRAMAEYFLSQGHELHGCSRSADGLEQLEKRFSGHGSFKMVNIANSGEVADWAKTLIGQFGTPDFLINNGAIMNIAAPLWEVPREEFDRLIDINIKGTANTIREFLPAMIDRGTGLVVNFSSGWGRSTAPLVAPYCASKWAIEGLTRALADELPDGLAGVVLNPGIINTDMLKRCFGDQASNFPTASDWVERAGPFILGLTSADNGRSVTVPG